MYESGTIHPETALALAFIAGCVYALVVFVLHHFDADHGLTPFLVVGGNAIIILFVYLTVGLDVAALLFGLNLCAGLPMIIEYYVSRIWHKRQRRF
ncbi:MAG: hypothetical protein KJZ86_24120 [Caldilineaceae bacterium]|nr:hypothetical protein [Caldilineaceae bacterium]